MFNYTTVTEIDWIEQTNCTAIKCEMASVKMMRKIKIILAMLWLP